MQTVMLGDNKWGKKLLFYYKKEFKKGKILPDNHVKLTYKTLPPQLSSDIISDIIINGIDDLHVFQRRT